MQARRRTAGGTDGYEALPFLSDHLALHLELTVTSR